MLTPRQVMDAAKVAKSGYDALQQKRGVGRPLTAGEIKLASSVYGGLIKYDRVKIYNARWREFMPEGRAHAPDGNIYFDSKAGYRQDFSTGLPGERGTFIHEMAHVWQVQRGENIIVHIPIQHGGNNASYKYAHIFNDQHRLLLANQNYLTQVPGKGKVHLYFIQKYEAQAEFVSDYYLIRSGGKADLPANQGFGRAQYERLMPPALRATAMRPAVPTS